MSGIRCRSGLFSSYTNVIVPGQEGKEKKKHRKKTEKYSIRE